MNICLDICNGLYLMGISYSRGISGGVLSANSPNEVRLQPRDAFRGEVYIEYSDLDGSRSLLSCV
jgi:hypothetical protein